MKSFNSVLSIYGYDLEFIIFQVILFFQMFKDNSFFFTKMKILHCSKVLIFIFTAVPLSVKDLWTVLSYVLFP